jgi:MoxR-like ATPase
MGPRPRATIALNMAARARAFLQHRGVRHARGHQGHRARRAAAPRVLTYEAEAEEITSDQVVGRVFEAIEVP